MIHTVVIFALVLSAANWIPFLAVVVVSNIAMIRHAFSPLSPKEEGKDESFQVRQAPLDKLIDSTGTLATSFNIAGPGSSAAAMSLVCLLIAAVAAGIDRF